MTRSWTLLATLALCGCSTTPRAPVMLRPIGTQLYRLTIDSDEGRGPRRLVADVAVTTRADGTDRVAIESATLGPPDEVAQPIEVEPAVRAAFGGDERVLGRFDVGPGLDPGELVPPGAPEPLVGLCTDLASLLLVQSDGFGAPRLQRAGDTHTFEGFEASWSHAPSLLDARVRCAGGVLRLVSVDDDEALLSWEPRLMDLALLRGGPGGARMLLAGTEDLVLTVRCDPRTGHLLDGRSVRNVVDLGLHMPFAGEVLPEHAEMPTSGGMRVRFERTILLEARGGA